jgi:hypothetical protein
MWPELSPTKAGIQRIYAFLTDGDGHLPVNIGSGRNGLGRSEHTCINHGNVIAPRFRTTLRRSEPWTASFIQFICRTKAPR